MRYYVGLDVSKDETAICVRDEDGQIALACKTPSTGEAISQALSSFAATLQRVVLETGMLAGLLHRDLTARGLNVICIDARQAWAVLRQMPNKTDANDAAMLAELARSGFFRQVFVKGVEAQAMRTLLKARALLVRQRLDADNMIRSALLARGTPLPRELRRWIDRVQAAVADDPLLRRVLQPLLELRAAIMASLAKLDRELRGTEHAKAPYVDTAVEHQLCRDRLEDSVEDPLDFVGRQMRITFGELQQEI